MRAGLNLWQQAALRSAVVRKAGACARQLPRAAARLRATPDDYRRTPPVLGNSFPKSGTHLLLQILRAFAPHHYGNFIASMPSVTFRERSREAHLRLIDRITPGEALPAHLFFDETYRQALAQKNVVHFFIYRDPRDVAVSDAHYLTYMGRWHRLHSYFARTLKSDDERLSAAILGVRGSGFPYDYPDIGQRFARYRGWLERDDVFAVRFEDLVSPRCAEVVHRMARFYVARCEEPADVNALARAAVRQIDGRRSHTFRRGEAGAWRSAMSERHLIEIERVAGCVLAELGYDRVCA
jgi:Sulfotransferase domain